MTPAMPLSRERARRAAVVAQLLGSPRPRDIIDTVRALWAVQIDPTSAVARTEHIVLFSRLGRRYRPQQLERLLWTDASLFEYRAFIFATSDLALHLGTMRGYPPKTGASRHEYIRQFLRENAAYRRHVLERLRTDGPLRTAEIDNRAKVGWRTGGWNDDKESVGPMLEVLWSRGEVMIVGRDGQQRLWDLAERRLPVDVQRPAAAVLAREVVERQLRAAGIQKARSLGWMMDGTKPVGWERALASLIKEEIAVPVTIDGVPGDWLAHTDALEAQFRPRTVLLSPFDRLIHDRERTEALFDFLYRLEIYVPKAKRRWGYFVLPVLSGDRLIGRIDPKFDRSTRVLEVHGVFAEGDASPSAGPKVRTAIDELAAWLGAADVRVGTKVPAPWRRAVRI
jgi:uncharacterized protein YcaQ